MARPLKERTIRYQFFLFAGIISFFTLLLVLGVVIGITVGIGESTTNLVRTTLEDQAKQNLLNETIQISEILNRKFKGYEDSIYVVIKAGKYLLEKGAANQLPFGPRKMFFWYDAQSAPPDVAFNDQFGYNVSLTTSVFLITGYTSDNYTDALMVKTISDTVSFSSHLDTFFPKLVIGRDISQIQVGFDNSIYRRFPGSDIFISRQYDPKDRPWYKVAAPGKRGVYVAPYRGAATKLWTISVSASMEQFTGPRGVVAAEIRLKTIDQLITQQTPLQLGYATLITDTGRVVSHPKWNYTLDNGDASPFLSTYSPDLFNSLKTFIGTGTTEMIVNQVDSLVAWSVLKNGYIVLFVIPKNDFLARLKPVFDSVKNTYLTTIIVSVVIAIVTLAVVLTSSSYLGLRVTAPVTVLSRVALQIARNATETNKLEKVVFNDEYNQADEIGDLTRAFTRMIGKLTGHVARPPSTEMKTASNFE